MTHASRLAAQLRVIEQDENVDEETKEKARQRREEIEEAADE